MRVIDAFYAAWTDARHTFGRGVPPGGARFDASTTLRRLGADVASASPGSAWSGGAAAAYDTRNAKYQAVFERLAELDQRLSRTVDRSAEVVTAGRQNLETLRQWVTAAASAVPPGRLRDAQLAQIAGTALERLGEIVRGAHGDLIVVAEDVVGIKNEYDALTSKGELPAESPGEEEPDNAVGDHETDMSSGDITEIDRANRELLQEMLEQYRQLPDGEVKTDRLADIAAIQKALRLPNSHLVYLEKPGDPSQMIPAATSVGDPFTADHVSVTVPGVGGTTRGTIAGMTSEAAELRAEARTVARRVGESQNIATVGDFHHNGLTRCGDPSIRRVRIRRTSTHCD